MLKRSLISWAAVAVLLGAGPWFQARASVQEANAASAAQATMLHLEGCLFTEAALTATTPIIIPTGTPQNYVLTEPRLISGSASADDVAKTTYALDKVDQEQMRALYGKRVGVTGRVRTAPTRPKIEIVSIREISGGCPVLPGLSAPK